MGGVFAEGAGLGLVFCTVKTGKVFSEYNFFVPISKNKVINKSMLLLLYIRYIQVYKKVCKFFAKSLLKCWILRDINVENISIIHEILIYMLEET